MATGQVLKPFPCFHRRQQLPRWSCVWGPVCVWLKACDWQRLQRPLQRERGSEHWHVCALWNWLLLPGEVLGVNREPGSALPNKAEHSSLKVCRPCVLRIHTPSPVTAPLSSHLLARDLLLMDHPPVSAAALQVPSAASSTSGL